MNICGIDEAGRGPCIGPLVLGAVVIEKVDEEKLREIGVKDSKQLTPAKREEMAPLVRAASLEHATLAIPPSELDDLMDRKSLNEIEAMKIGQLLNQLRHKPEVCYIDSPDTIAANFAKRIKPYLSFQCRLKTEHKADIKYPVVSAASILAKVDRDHAITALEPIWGKLGSGYPHDPATISFLEKYVAHHKRLPSICRHKWETSQRILAKQHQTKLF
ncbi:MAG: ribonuclease HII [Candidatus Diapherotrites archaeon]|nr:ribonuclease HII [Candidatus Diapherotrites archaeon]